MHTPTPTPAKRPGRPPIPIDLDRVRELASLGLNADHIAARLGVSRRTLFQRMSEDPAYREALDQGVASGVETAARTLREMAAAGNVAAIIFFLKTKGGFVTPKEPTPAPIVHVHLDGSAPAPVTIDHISALEDEQRRLLAPPQKS
jgi:hypothetical protein